MNPITSKKTSLDLDIGDTGNLFKERYRRIIAAGLLFIAAVYPGELGEVTRLSIFDAYTQVSVFVAATLLFFGYALILVTVVFLLGEWVESLSDQLSGWGWQLTALTIGFLHFLFALALFRKLKQSRELTLFEFTRAELNKDREWLNKSKTSANENENSS